MQRLSLILLVLLVALPGYAIDETLQVQFLKQLFQRPESEWPEMMKQNTRVLDSSFFDRSEARIRWSLENNQVEDALRFALVTDLACDAVGRTGQYRLGLAQAFYKAGNYNMAKDLTDSILLRNSKDFAAKEFYAHMYRNQMDFFNAWATYDELQKAGYKRTQCLNEMALIDLVQDKEERARQEFAEVLRIDPGNKLANEELGKLNQAMRFSPPGYKDKPENASNPPVANSGGANRWFMQAEESYKAGKLDAAEGYYKKTIENDPTYVIAYVYLGALYYRQAALDNAIEVLTKAVSLDAKDFEGWRFLGNCYERRYDTKGNKADLEAAVSSYQRGQEISPEDRTIKTELERARDKKNPS